MIEMGDRFGLTIAEMVRMNEAVFSDRPYLNDRVR
jgi:hypothetical protein